MRGSSWLTDAQLAEAERRRRSGQLDSSVMTNEERLELGLMDRQQAAAHERLRQLPHARLAERSRKPLADDPWVTPESEAA